MKIKVLNPKINRAAAAVFIAAAPTALIAVGLTAGSVTFFGFTGRVNRTLNNGFNRLRLDLRGNFGHGVLSNQTRWNLRRGNGWNIHAHLPTELLRCIWAILPAFSQKIINHFMVCLGVVKLLIVNIFNLNTDVIFDNTGLSLCTQQAVKS
jgi:hypothetical protein